MSYPNRLIVKTASGATKALAAASYNHASHILKAMLGSDDPPAPVEEGSQFLGTLFQGDVELGRITAAGEIVTADGAVIAIEDDHDVERFLAARLMEHALTEGFLLSVNDGEVWVVRSSTDLAEVLDAMFSTEMDLVRFRKNGESHGTLEFLWGNSPDEAIHDHADKPVLSALAERYNAFWEEYQNARQ